MKSREIPVKLSRVITLFGIVSASIIARAFLVVAFLFAQPALDAASWHLHHGNKVAFDGHTFHVPLMWYATPEPYRNSLVIDQAYGAGNIELNATGEVLDPTAARAWQAKTISDANKFNQGAPFNNPAESFTARVSSSSVSVMTMAPCPILETF